MKILKVFLLTRILQLPERWKIRKWRIFDFFVELEALQLEWRMFLYDSDIESNWVTSVHSSSQKFIQNYLYFLKVWKFQNVGYALGFYSSLSNKRYANWEWLKLWFNVWILYTNIPRFKWIKFSNIHHFFKNENVSRIYKIWKMSFLFRHPLMPSFHWIW